MGKINGGRRWLFYVVIGEGFGRKDNNIDIKKLEEV